MFLLGVVIGTHQFAEAVFQKVSMSINVMHYVILVPYVEFKKWEKHPWRSVNFSKVADFSLQLY